MIPTMHANPLTAPTPALSMNPLPIDPYVFMELSNHLLLL